MTIYTWNGASGEWSDVEDWSPSGPPGLDDNVLLTAPGSYTVTLDGFPGNAEIGSLTVSSAAKLVTDDLAGLTLVGGFANSGVVDVETFFLVRSLFDNAGAMTFGAGAIVTFQAPVTTAELGTFNVVPGAKLDFESPLENSNATLNLGAGAEVYGAIEGGAIEGTLNCGGHTSGGEPLTLEGAIAFVGEGGVGGGVINITNEFPAAQENDGKTLRILGDETLADVIINMGGPSDLQGVSYPGLSKNDVLSFDDNLTLAADARVNQQQGVAEIQGGDAFLNYGNISVGDGGYLTISASGFTNAGVLNIEAGSQIAVDVNLFTFAAGSTIHLGGNLTVTGGADFAGGLIDGSKYLVTTGATSVSGLEIGGAAVWVNTGIATQSVGDVTIGASSGSVAILYNTATGVYDITDDSGVALGAGAASYINNAGLFEKTGGTGTSAIAASLLNSGEIRVESGTLDLLGQLWGQGRVDVGADATLQFGAAVGATASATVYVAGALTFASGATLTLAGENLGLEGAADFAGATLEGADRLTTFAATAMSGLAVGGAAVWLNAATVTQSGGDLTLGDSSGGAAIAFNQAIYDIVDDSGVESGAAAAYVNNAGLFEKTGGAGTSVVAANMYSAGTIEAASGTLDFQAALWGPGTSKVDAGAMLEVDGVVGGASILAFHGSGGAVALDDLYAGGVDLFHGSIQGFAAGDTIDAGAYGIGTSALFTENGAGTGGALTLTNGGATASITMTGVYATANFAMASDGHGGTLLTFHA
jgi:hypothetical protein